MAGFGVPPPPDPIDPVGNPRSKTYTLRLFVDGGEIVPPAQYSPCLHNGDGDNTASGFMGQWKVAYADIALIPGVAPGFTERWGDPVNAVVYDADRQPLVVVAPAHDTLRLGEEPLDVEVRAFSSAALAWADVSAPETDGWRPSWFGWLYWPTENGDWIWHPAHGWEYCAAFPPSQTGKPGWAALWDNAAGVWLFTSDAFYPALYSYATHHWYYYMDGVEAGRTFWDYSGGAYVGQDALAGR